MEIATGDYIDNKHEKMIECGNWSVCVRLSMQHCAPIISLIFISLSDHLHADCWSICKRMVQSVSICLMNKELLLQKTADYHFHVKLPSTAWEPNSQLYMMRKTIGTANIYDWVDLILCDKRPISDQCGERQVFQLFSREKNMPGPNLCQQQ